MTGGTVFLTAGDLRALTERLGAGPVRDENLLAGAAGRPTMTMFGQDLFPSVIGKAAALLHGIVTSHPLVDGNKRLGWLACVVFCNLNGIELDGTNDEVVQFVIDVATHVIPDAEAVAARLASLIKHG